MSLPEGVNDITDDTRTAFIYFHIVKACFSEQVAIAIQLLSVVTTGGAGHLVICCK